VDVIADIFQKQAKSKILGEPIPYEKLTIGVVKETFENENRVALSPDSVELLVKAGFHVIVQSGAGEKASFSDAAYVDKSAIVLPGEQVYVDSDIITKINTPDEDEIPKLAGKTLIGMISPSINVDIYDKLSNQNTNVFALDCVPRMLSRAQTYDVLSSQANIAGYRAVIEAAEEFPRFFAGQMTAAGKVPPAKVLVLGM
jgi:NAD/NADP transhydrogenase alpha subunit